MVNSAGVSLFRGKFRSLPIEKEVNALTSSRNTRRKRFLLAVAIFLSPIAIAQGVPQVTSIDPTSGKVSDTATLGGQDLGKDSVAAVFLSDDKDDFKATIVDQSDEKIVVKIPQVKAGEYNISVQVGNKLFIKPVKFTVAE